MGDPKPIGAALAPWITAARARSHTLDSPELVARRERFFAEREQDRLKLLREIAELRGVPVAREWELLSKADPGGSAVRTLADALAWRACQPEGTPLVLVLSSAPGVGKSVALRHAVTQAPPSARYVLSHRFAGLVEWKNEELFRSMRSVKLLALDEFGLERDPAPVSQLLVERWDAGLITLVATNLGIEDLDKRMDARVLDRVEQQRLAGLDWLVLLSESSRRTGGAT